MNCSKELFNGISRAQLVAELKAERDVLTACVLSCATVARAHFQRELRDVLAFIEYLAAVPQNTPQTGKESQRCAHSKEIRRCFAIAREHGLDTRADEAMRAAIGRQLGFTVETREVLNGYQWKQVGDMVKRGALAW